MSEYLSKKAVLNSAKSRIEWFRNRSEEWKRQGVVSKQKEMYEASIALEEFVSEIQSGRFDAEQMKNYEDFLQNYEDFQRKYEHYQTELQRLRAALEKARQYVVNGYELGYIDDREGYTEALVREIDKALSTTEPINDTDVKEIEDIPESRKDEIAKMSRKELNAHAFLLEQEQVEYEREKRQLLTKLAEKEAKLNQAVEALEWIVECGTDYQSINKARNALCEIKGGESDE